MKRKLFFYVTTILITASLVFGSVPLGAVADGDGGPATAAIDEASATVTHKEEVVYSTLYADGTIKEIYVVNIFDVAQDGYITDTGAYSSIKNLTNVDPIYYENGQVSFSAPRGRFYYQGNMEEQSLPWDIKISFLLDGAAVDPGELGGASGHLEMDIFVSGNASVNSVFSENYMLQVTVTLNSNLCHNIVAEGSTIANAGTDKLITFTVMPGKEERLSLSADVEDFEMEGVSISGVPFSMNLDIGDLSEMTDGLTSLADAISQLNEGVSKLDDGGLELSGGLWEIKDGMSQLSDGIDELYHGAYELYDGTAALQDGTGELAAGMYKLFEGSAEFSEGLYEINEGSGTLLSGSQAIMGALNAINSGLSSGLGGEMDLSQLGQLSAGLTTMADGLDAISLGMQQLSSGYAAGYSALASAIEAIPPAINDADIAALIIATSNDPTLQALIDQYTAAQTVKATYEYVAPALAAVSTTLPSLATNLDSISSGLRTAATQFEAALQGLDQLENLTELVKGIGALTANYSDFHKGLATYLDGVYEMYRGYLDLHIGIKEAADGTAKLYSGTGDLKDGVQTFADGVGDLNDGTASLAEGMGEAASGADSFTEGISALADGMAELDSETKDIPDKIESEIDSILADYDTSDFIPVSFTSGNNANVSSVQFVLVTEGITRLEPKSEDQAEVDEETFWSRFISLFTSKK